MIRTRLSCTTHRLLADDEQEPLHYEQPLFLISVFILLAKQRMLTRHSCWMSMKSFTSTFSSFI